VERWGYDVTPCRALTAAHFPHRLEVARWLLDEQGLDVDEGTADGTTPFMWAVWQGHAAVASYLVDEAGCDFRATNSFGCNATQFAAQEGSVAMLRFLRGVGLDVGVVNHNGHSALHKASVTTSLMSSLMTPSSNTTPTRRCTRPRSRGAARRASGCWPVGSLQPHISPPSANQRTSCWPVRSFLPCSTHEDEQSLTIYFRWEV